MVARDRTIMRWLAHRGGAQHHRRWKAAGRPEPLPACAVLGADPGTILAAVITAVGTVVLFLMKEIPLRATHAMPEDEVDAEGSALPTEVGGAEGEAHSGARPIPETQPEM